MSTDAPLFVDESSDSPPIPRSRRGDWTWEMVAEYPRQGEWTEADYLNLNEDIRAELVGGCLEFLPMSTWIHAFIMDHLHEHLKAYVRSRRLGITSTSGGRVRTTYGQVRDPDVVFLKPQRMTDLTQPSEGADLVMEIVSEGHAHRRRDLEEKREEYAAAGIPEYWIVDPEQKTITVLTLATGTNEYAEHGVFRPGQQASSVLLPEFAVDVAACFAAGKGPLS